MLCRDPTAGGDTVERRAGAKAGGRLTAQQAAELLREWKQSGETLAGYARKAGIRYQRLYWWKQRLGVDPRPASSTAEAFLPVRILEAPKQSEADPVVEILTPGGMRILVPRGFDEPALERLLRTLKRAAC
jgi:hypothetical protein